MEKDLILKRETMSSLEIAELTGRRHADVIRDIRKLLGKELTNATLRWLITLMQKERKDLVTNSPRKAV